MTHYSEINTLSETLAFHAKKHGDKLALITQDRKLTYREIHLLAHRVSRALKNENLPKGSRIAYLAHETENYFALLFACALSQHVLVPINWRLSADEVDYIGENSQARLLFVDKSMESRIKSPQQYDKIIVLDEEDGESGFRHWSLSCAEKPYDNTLPLEDGAKPDDPIAQLYTSGTTGNPKGVVIAHRSFFKVRDALHRESLDWIDWRENDISLIGVPGFHIGGLWWALQGFNAGICNVSMPFFTPSLALRLIREKQVTTACLVPAMMQMILNEFNVDQQHFSALRKIVYGGSPISESLLNTAFELMQCQFVQIYGLTETGNTAICLPPEQHQGKRLKSAGKPYPGFKAKIVDKNNSPLPAGKVGEILVQTPAVMLAYWNNETATAETFVDKWLKTGDVGYMDEKGYVYVHDRLKDTIIVAGENVYPAEVENALAKIPQILESAVIGIPDESWGEKVMAYIVLNDNENVKSREIIRKLQAYIADYKIPTTIQFVDSIPRNPSGKILKKELRKKFWANRERLVN